MRPKRVEPERALREFVLSVRVSEATKAAIERAAALERRSVSQWLEIAAEAALKKSARSAG